jgi:hypothetical protein
VIYGFHSSDVQIQEVNVSAVPAPMEAPLFMEGVGCSVTAFVCLWGFSMIFTQKIRSFEVWTGG